MTPLIEACGLTKRFGKVVALDALDLVVPAGGVTAVLGPNGAGKTTLVRTIATLQALDAGRLEVCGHDAVREAPTVRRLIGLAGQSAAVDEALTGRENLVLVARLYGWAASTLERMGMGDAADRRVGTYSGGRRRRLDLGASLVGAPRLLLMDEPTTGLDPASRIELWDTIRSMADAGTEFVLTSQYLEEADQLASLIVIIDHGRVIAQGAPGELKSRAGTDRIEVRTRDARSLDLAVAALDRLVGARPEVDRSVHRCTVAAPGGPHLLPAAVRALDEAGVTVEDLALRRPTLDEVFLALTGRAPVARLDHDGNPAAIRPEKEPASA